MKSQEMQFDILEKGLLKTIQEKEKTVYPYYMKVYQSGSGFSHVFSCYWDEYVRPTFAIREDTHEQGIDIFFYAFGKDGLENYYMKNDKQTVISMKTEGTWERSDGTRMLTHDESFLTDIQEAYYDLIKEKTEWVKRECPPSTLQEIIVYEEEWEAVTQNEKLKVEISRAVLEKY